VGETLNQGLQENGNSVHKEVDFEDAGVTVFDPIPKRGSGYHPARTVRAKKEIPYTVPTQQTG
jgi:hypothetical protein